MMMQQRSLPLLHAFDAMAVVGTLPPDKDLWAGSALSQIISESSTSRNCQRTFRKDRKLVTFSFVLEKLLRFCNRRWTQPTRTIVYPRQPGRVLVVSESGSYDVDINNPELAFRKTCMADCACAICGSHGPSPKNTQRPYWGQKNAHEQPSTVASRTLKSS